MQKDIKENQDSLFQECMENSRLILEDQRSGIYWQITGAVPPKDFYQRIDQNTSQKK